MTSVLHWKMIKGEMVQRNQTSWKNCDSCSLSLSHSPTHSSLAFAPTTNFGHGIGLNVARFCAHFGLNSVAFNPVTLRVLLETLFPLPSTTVPSWFPSGFSFFKKRFYLLIFRERGREGETEEENHWCVRETLMSCLSHTPSWGPGLEPRHVPCWESNQQLFCSQAGAQSMSHTSQGPLIFLTVTSSPTSASPRAKLPSVTTETAHSQKACPIMLMGSGPCWSSPRISHVSFTILIITVISNLGNFVTCLSSPLAPIIHHSRAMYVSVSAEVPVLWSTLPYS